MKGDQYGDGYAAQSAAVRARLKHPDIDSDGHTVEKEQHDDKHT
jgi:hypothetical protein